MCDSNRGAYSKIMRESFVSFVIFAGILIPQWDSLVLIYPPWTMAGTPNSSQRSEPPKICKRARVYFLEGSRSRCGRIGASLEGFHFFYRFVQAKQTGACEMANEASRIAFRRRCASPFAYSVARCVYSST
jgi:hypothetical protein